MSDHNIEFSDFSLVWSEMHNKDIETSPFKIGEEVIYYGNFGDLRGTVYKINGVNQVNKNDFEYSLEGFPFLVWVEEIATKGKFIHA